MLGKANPEVTPTFAGGLQKPQRRTWGIWSYLTLHTQDCGKERLVRFHATRSTHASRVRHLKRSCCPNSRLTGQLKSCHSGASMTIGVGWSHTEKQWEKQNKGPRILVPGTDSLLHLRHYLVWFRAKGASWGSTWSTGNRCIYLVHHPALS